MPRLIHLSDLHFGAHDPRLVDAVEEQVNADKPDLVVISGDLTQRAKTEQFKEACRFLERLRDAGHDVLAVPGNHDIPLYDVLRRFLSPLMRYRRYIDDTLCPFIELPGVAVLGINTARSLTFSDGRVSHEQMDFIRESFARTDPKMFRVLVTHHPMFALPVGDGPELGKAIGRQEHALDAIAEAGIDMLFAGHNHRPSTHDAADLVTRAGSALVIQAGTATSVRLRGEEQSFNRIQIDGDDVAVTEISWNGDAFVPGEPAAYRRTDADWKKGSAAKAAQLSDTSA
jgi:3',5'-cyclic AMP phosphodiesterase CpdA